MTQAKYDQRKVELQIEIQTARAKMRRHLRRFPFDAAASRTSGLDSAYKALDHFITHARIDRDSDPVGAIERAQGIDQ